MRKVSVVLRILGIKKSQKGDWLALACKLPGHFVGDDPVDAQPGQLVWTFGLDFLQTFDQGAGDIFQFVRYGQLTGYGRGQMEELRETIARSDADLVLIGTPIDLRRVIELDKQAFRVTYRLEEIGEPTLASLLEARGIIESAPALT